MPADRLQPADRLASAAALVQQLGTKQPALDAGEDRRRHGVLEPDLGARALECMQPAGGIALASTQRRLEGAEHVLGQHLGAIGHHEFREFLGPARGGWQVAAAGRHEAGHMGTNVAIEPVVQHEWQADARQFGAGIPALQLLLQRVELGRSAGSVPAAAAALLPPRCLDPSATWLGAILYRHLVGAGAGADGGGGRLLRLVALDGPR